MFTAVADHGGRSDGLERHRQKPSQRLAAAVGLMTYGAMALIGVAGVPLILRALGAGRVGQRKTNATAILINFLQ